MTEPLGEAIRQELARLGPEGAATTLAGAWPEAVGEGIARHAWPARVRGDGTLVVHVRDAVWGFELTQRAGEISARLPGAPKLQFVPGPLPDQQPEPAPEPGREPPRATLEQEREAAEWAAGIADAKLRALVARTAAASLARAAAATADDRPV
ncbi:MAG TPA: DUF721 domain-containing protein [Gaiellaceae bacterium]|nr:DUF721 domain-containing protein [Gaiellaceae bacterium]